MTDVCQTCKNWGRTISHEENITAIPCSDCGRLTWPNLGVNCPAGMAVAFATATSVQIMRQLQAAGLIADQPFIIYAESRPVKGERDAESTT